MKLFSKIIPSFYFQKKKIIPHINNICKKKNPIPKRRMINFSRKTGTYTEWENDF